MRIVLNTMARHAPQSQEASAIEKESRYMSPILFTTWWSSSPFSQRPLAVSALVRSHPALSTDVLLPYVAVHFALSMSSRLFTSALSLIRCTSKPSSVTWPHCTAANSSSRPQPSCPSLSIFYSTLFSPALSSHPSPPSPQPT